MLNHQLVWLYRCPERGSLQLGERLETEKVVDLPTVHSHKVGGSRSTRPGREVVVMQYAKMIDLIEAAKKAGYEGTEHVNHVLAQAFESWIGEQNLPDITEEEEDVLRLAFEVGYGICMHGSK
jgi:predicted DNA binding protein